MAGARPHGGGSGGGGNGGDGGDGGGNGGDGGDGTPGRPGHPRGGSGNVSAAHETISGEANQGRAPGADGGPARPGDGGTPGHGDDRTPGTESPELAATGPEPGSPRAFVDNIAADPRSVAGRSAEDIAAQFRAAGYDVAVEQSTRRGTSGNAVQVRVRNHPEITNIQVHPGGGRHTPEGSAYWKISTNTSGKTWVIPGDFRGADDLGGNVIRYDE
ncbi:hypothetical protein [Pseudosporangium ferrugineum]|uniref:Uncharacterized protein n=1 Tax=Pseudosporangium ferrugineum TaxID=439699 RepID=A0A2T0SIT7_9ACTN|nr:hypothetical protein [Pseudosporangium ferrugineum]PRY33336.1 hypothetical protein CLV70_101498 [Pseudosporangium ferrugineum]